MFSLLKWNITDEIILKWNHRSQHGYQNTGKNEFAKMIKSRYVKWPTYFRQKGQWVQIPSSKFHKITNAVQFRHDMDTLSIPEKLVSVTCHEKSC